MSQQSSEVHWLSSAGFPWSSAFCRNVNVQIHSTAPALFALFLLLDGDDKPPWLSIALDVLYIQMYLTLRPEREKKVSLEYFPTAPSPHLCLSGWSTPTACCLCERVETDRSCSALWGRARLAAHASVIMAVSHIAGWQRRTVAWVALRTQTGSGPSGSHGRVCLLSVFLLSAFGI